MLWFSKLLLMAMCASKVALITISLKIFFFTQLTLGVQYRVGGLQGWDYGIDYQTWASSITFKQGDTLYFEYAAKMHSVLEVSEQDYKTCNTRAPIRSDGGQGKKVVKLEVGTFYFICGLPAHCSEGRMKLAVPVQAASTTFPIPSPSSYSPSISTPSSSTPRTIPFSPLLLLLVSSFAL